MNQEYKYAQADFQIYEPESKRFITNTQYVYVPRDKIEELRTLLDEHGDDWLTEFKNV